MEASINRGFFLPIICMEISRPKRNFVAEDLVVDSWDVIQPYYANLVDRQLDTEADFKQWLKDRSELDAVLEEDAAWRYIKMTCDTSNKEFTDRYTFFVTEIQPQMMPFEDQLNQKMMASPFATPENKEQAYQIYHRSVNIALQLFREENIALDAKLNERSQEFGAISGAQTVEHNGEQLTMQQASQLLKEREEEVRKSVFEKIASRRAEDKEQLDALFTELVQLRHQVATNAGFENYRDYKFVELGRFDYTKEDCFDFHNAIKKEIVPIAKQIQQAKLDKMKLEKFKPWDLELDPDGLEPLKPFKDGDELLDGTIELLAKIDPYFSDCLDTMKTMGYLDLDSKKGKAPGGYNYPLYEIGVPFIFMNAVGSQRDLVTMVHEGGHAIHSFLSRDLELTGYKDLTSEIAELASMSMELLTMDQWSQFYSPADVVRAKQDHLEDILKVLPWIAQIDEFQHWIYENPNHSVAERTETWKRLNSEYGTGLTDWTGYEEVRDNSWQRQMHLFEVPFYYIEYGIAQLGAIGVWKNSMENYDKAIHDYKEALKLGYTKTIPEIYQTAGVEFRFDQEYIKTLADFVKVELDKLS